MAKRVDPLADQVIKAFGGLTATSKATGIAVSTVDGWHRNGIPPWRRNAIRSAAEKTEGVELPAAFLKEEAA
ncbi:MAG TPA: hypothetical protein VD994_10560 [Prosthecobacter sp.]|nr:hypothetical protein [Prosthecobacter sp.]